MNTQRGTRLSSRPRLSTVSGEVLKRQVLELGSYATLHRSVLLYNKHGLLMDAFMKEYREACGKPLPFK